MNDLLAGLGLAIVLEGLLGHGWAGALVMTGALITVMGLVVMALSPDS